MSLENAYSAVPKKTISTFSCAGRMPIMQRDEIFINLENNIVSQMLDVLPKEAIEREVITSCNCKIVRIIDSSDSLHIYKGDLEQAKGIVKKYLPIAMR